MKTLIVGSSGQLGQSLLSRRPKEIPVKSVHYPTLDLTKPNSLKQILGQVQPDVIINAAAYTNVDAAESETDLAYAVNAEGPKYLADYANQTNARLIHVSTDYVYGGDKSTPYLTTDPSHPLGVYGESKYRGDNNVLQVCPQRSTVIRTAWLYSEYGKNFVLTMLALMRSKSEVSVVGDQIGSHTWAGSLADVSWRIVTQGSDLGLLHWTDAGEISWYDFAVSIQTFALDSDLLPQAIPINVISSKEFPTQAKRPAYSVLDCRKACDALDIKQVHWQHNLQLMLKQLSQNG